MMTADGATLLDWDMLCAGPPAWDHAMLLRLDRWGWPRRWYDEFAAGYGRSLAGEPDGGRARRAAPRRGHADAPARRVGRPVGDAGGAAPPRLLAWRPGRPGVDRGLSPYRGRGDARPAARPAARRRGAGRLRLLWAVPAALPDVPGDGGGGPLTARADRRDAWRAVARRQGGRRLRATSWRRACSAAAASRRARAACRSDTSWREHGTPSPSSTARRRAGCAPAWRCSAGIVCCGPARRCSPWRNACTSCRNGSVCRASRFGRGPQCARRHSLLSRRSGADVRVRHGGRSSALAGRMDTWLFTGCVMDAWMRSTHRATAAVLGAVGSTYAVPGRGGACCGALHEHAGLVDEASELARRVIASMPGDAPVVVNSAGCGATMKEYGRLLGTDEAAAFAARVVDVHEYLAARLDRLPAPRRSTTAGHRAGPLSPPPRATGARTGADGASPRHRRR